jgi:enoyl-CoA hydratase/carnithine racemase
VAVATFDARLLAPVGPTVPAAEAVSDVLGQAALVLFDGDWSWFDKSGAEREPTARFLSEVPVLTIAVGAPATLPFDLHAVDAPDADRLVAGFGRAPRAALAAALLVRRPPPDPWTGLVAESTTYSMLQAGPEFRAWLATCRPASPRPDNARRVDVRRNRRIVEVVLTRASRHNALDTRMRDELDAALGDVERDGHATLVVRGEGPSFCSGGDLGEFGTFPDPVTAHCVRLGRSLAARCARLGPRMLVGLHGACLGAGIELPAFAARVIAADDASIGLPETGLGLLPGAGGTVSIPRRAGREPLLRLLLTGDRIDAPTALGWGLVDEIVPRDGLLDRLRSAAEQMGRE